MKTVEQLSIDTIKVLSAEAVEKANSGHPGLPLGQACATYTLWAKFLRHYPNDAVWPNRDRFVLSAGHGSMLLYSLLHLFGYGLTMQELQAFRQWGSRTPGHPEYGHTPGVEATTGPLGQGFANAVGMAIGEKRLAAEFNREGYPIVDHYTYILASDGDLMEGVTSEAASLAGHLQLEKLICLYDDNQITIDGSTNLAFSDNTAQKFSAMGWRVIEKVDGHDPQAVYNALSTAKSPSTKPTLIMLQTTIGYGSPNKQGKANVHGSPLGKEELAAFKKNINWLYPEEFYVPDLVSDHFTTLSEGLKKDYETWQQLFADYRATHPALASQWDTWHTKELSPALDSMESLWDFPDKPLATRSVSGDVMNKIAPVLPNLVGGSADLNASTKTYLKSLGDFTADNPKGNNLFFGVREHAMGAISNGLSLYGGLRVFCSTFFVFFDYMKPSVRLAALMGLPVIYVFTHDSLGVGEDGPTHQPIEHLAALRAIPNMQVLRPCDARETATAWLAALKRTDGPSALILTRQDLAQIPGTSTAAEKGAYVLRKEQSFPPDLMLLASGSEVSLAIKAQEVLHQEGISTRVVSMMSWELFAKQPKSYREETLPTAASRRISIEAGSTFGWHTFTGDQGFCIGIDTFGASAPGEKLMVEMGFSVENIVQKAKSLLLP